MILIMGLVFDSTLLALKLATIILASSLLFLLRVSITFYFAIVLGYATRDHLFGLSLHLFSFDLCCKRETIVIYTGRWINLINIEILNSRNKFSRFSFF
jgi:hypothetical protein